jgi:DNA-binding GntR family transcriptional regulator
MSPRQSNFCWAMLKMDAVTKPRLVNPEAGDLTLASQRVTESIRDLILSGEMAPGSRIRQEELAERFGTSRIPVREALRRLESDGLVRLIPNSSAWVAKIDMGECIEVYKIRELVEPLALSESVSRMTDQQILALERLVASLEAAATTEEFLRLDREFHLASYRPAQMQQLYPIIERFWNTTQQYRRAFTKLLGDEGSWIIHSEHRLLMEAVRRRDAAGAAHILFEHVRRTRFELERNRETIAPDERSRQRDK